MNFSSLGLVEDKFLFLTLLFPFLEVDWVNVKDSNQGQQKDTNIFRIDLKFLKKLISLMNQSPFMTVFAFLFHLNKAHLFENLVEEHVIDFGLSRRRDIEALNDPVVFLDKLLGHVSLIV